MGKASQIGTGCSPQKGAPSRSREEVLRDVKLAIAQDNNYGREARVQGANPYNSYFGKPRRDIWGGRRPV
jgi:hypothetical protein